MTAAEWLPSSVRAHGLERRLKAGEALFHARGRSSGFYEVVSGTIRLVRVDRSGREAILQVARAGDSLAEATLSSTCGYGRRRRDQAVQRQNRARLHL